MYVSAHDGKPSDGRAGERAAFSGHVLCTQRCDGFTFTARVVGPPVSLGSEELVWRGSLGACLLAGHPGGNPCHGDTGKGSCRHSGCV